MVVKNLISAAVAGLFLSTVVGLAPAAAQQPKSLASDSAFIAQAGSAGLLQVKLAKLVDKKGSSTSVMEFGKRMVTDYSKQTKSSRPRPRRRGSRGRSC